MKVQNSNINGSRSLRRRAVCLLAPGVVGLTVLLVGGCGQKAKQAEAPIQQQGNLNPPVVISGKPARDSKALMDADEQLSEADWKVLEQLGPRPIWQQVDKKSRRGRPGAASTGQLPPA